MAVQTRSAGLALIGILVFGAWGMWRWFLVAGGPWLAGHSCSSLVACRDGLCLMHDRDPGGALKTTEGYCSKRCKTDADCPADMGCEALPSGISRKQGDHLPLVQDPERLCVRGPRGVAEKK